MCVSVCLNSILHLFECCTHWHGLAAMQGTDRRLSLGVCGELDEGATWKKEQMHITHTHIREY